MAIKVSSCFHEARRTSAECPVRQAACSMDLPSTLQTLAVASSDAVKIYSPDGEKLQSKTLARWPYPDLHGILIEFEHCELAHAG